MRLSDGFEDAFVGTTMGAFSRKQVALYDYHKCIMILMHDQNMTEEEAIEYFNYNVIGSWVGEFTPIYIVQHKIEEIDQYAEEQ